MDHSNSENTYDFAKKQQKKTVQTLTIASVAVILVILLFLGWGLLTSIDFGAKKEKVTAPISDPKQSVDVRATDLQNTKSSYASAGIPYDDPKGRYSIDFMTSYPSNQILIAINVKDPDGSIKKEAEARVARAQSIVEISSVSYINSN